MHDVDIGVHPSACNWENLLTSLQLLLPIMYPCSSMVTLTSKLPLIDLKEGISVGMF